MAHIHLLSLSPRTVLPLPVGSSLVLSESLAGSGFLALAGGWLREFARRRTNFAAVMDRHFSPPLQ